LFAVIGYFSLYHPLIFNEIMDKLKIIAHSCRILEILAYVNQQVAILVLDLILQSYFDNYSHYDALFD